MFNKVFAWLFCIIINTPIYGCCGPADLCQPCQPGTFKIAPESNTPVGLSFSPNGACLAVANMSGDINVFSVDSVTCDLTLNDTVTPICPGPSICIPGAITYSKNNCLAIAVESNFSFPVFSPGVDCLPGSPTFTNAGGSTIDVAFNPGGSCLAASVPIAGMVSLFNMNVCTPPPSPSNFISITFPTSISFSTNGKCLGIISGSSLAIQDTISIYTQSAPCNFDTLVFTKTFAGSKFVSLAFSSNDCFALLDQNNNNIRVFTVLKDCSLKEIPGSPFPNGCLAQGSSISTITNFPTALAFSPNGSCLVVANAKSNNISVFNVDPETCELQFRGCPLSLGQGKTPIDIAFSPNGKCFAVANKNNTITIFMLHQTLTICSATADCTGIVTITGIANPGDLVQVFCNSTLIGSEPVPPSGPGSFTVITDTPIPAGQQRLTVIACQSGCPASSTSVTVCVPSKCK